MGNPKRQRKKYLNPTHPWQRDRILVEKELLKRYGLKRKYEIWKMSAILKNFTKQAKRLISASKAQADKEKNQLIARLSSLGLINKDTKIEDVLSLTLYDIMERRLQTLVYKKNMAGTFMQARQFIVHEHISVNNRAITAPSYLVPLNEESTISFTENSPFGNKNHPERDTIKKRETKKTK